MGYETLILEKKDKIATITLNRPPMNPLNVKGYYELIEVSKEINDDRDVKVVIFRGAGDKAFCAGLDVKDVEGKDIPWIVNFLNNAARKGYETIAAIEKPTVAAINGLALGGGLELALSCDIRIAADNAKMGNPEVTLGIIPGGGATQRLSRLICTAKAKEMLFLGTIIDAPKAMELGIVSAIYPLDKLMEEANKLASKLAKMPAVALKMIKMSIDNGYNMDIHSGLKYEQECFVVAYVSEDGREGLKAFLEKRKPVFKDK